MIRTPAPNTLPMAHSAYARGYERLRRHAVNPGAEHVRHGLAVIARYGVAAWLHAFAELPATPVHGQGRGAPRSLPAEVQRPVIDIVLAMLQGHMGRTWA